MSLKILHIVRTPLTVRAFMKPLLTEHHRRGHQVELAYAPDPQVDDDFGVPVHPYPLQRSLSPWGLIQAIRNLKDIIVKGKYDVVVPHMVLAGMVGRWAYAQAGCPGKLLYVSHGLPCYPHSPPWKRWATRHLEQWFSRYQQGMIVLNQNDYQIAQPFKHDQTYLLNTIGIDIDSITQRAQQVDVATYRDIMGLSHDYPLICYAGRFIEAKGVDQFIRIAHQVLQQGAKAHFVIAGTGPLEGFLQTYIKQHHLAEHIDLLGWTDETIELFAASDVMCFPTRYEGAPIVVQEAMAAGALVLTSDVPGPIDLIDHDETGLIAPAGDIQGFAKQLVEILSQPERQQRIVEQARLKAQEFDVKLWAPRWVDVIEETARG